MADFDAALGKQLLDTAKAQGEAEIQPDRVENHVGETDDV